MWGKEVMYMMRGKEILRIEERKLVKMLLGKEALKKEESVRKCT